MIRRVWVPIDRDTKIENLADRVGAESFVFRKILTDKIFGVDT